MSLATPVRDLRGYSLEQYAQGVSRVALPEPAELERLFRAARDGDDEAHQRIVNAHLRYVVDMALTRRDCGASLRHLIEAGNRGLQAAVRRFDPDGRQGFLDYARSWIRREMMASLDVV